MIKFITYIIIYTFGILTSLAQIKSEQITLYNKSIQLPGTLTYSSNKSPLVIWVHGSGGVDRNGNPSEFIKQFRESINKNDISFFSYDKRTANLSNLKFLKEDGVYFSDFIDDVKVVVNHFKNDKRFSKIILIGHSQGSLVAMMALNNVDKYISLAGVGETIDKTLVKQTTKQNIELGRVTKNHLKELKETGKIENINPFLVSLFAKQNQPFLLSWIEIDPLLQIKKVKIPTLIINGDKDIQVSVNDAEKLHKAKQDSELVIIKNMNHILKNIEKDEDNLRSYTSKDYPISKELIVSISKFIKE